MIWCALLAVLAGLTALPLGVRLCYNEDGPRATLLAGPVRLRLYPRPCGKSQKGKKEKAKGSPKIVEEKVENAPSSGGNWKDFLPLVKTALAFLGDLRRKLRINRLQFKLVLAGEDPCDLAVNYGRAWTAVGNLLAAMEESFTIKKRDVEVQCDFTSTETRVTARVDVTISLGRLLVLAARYGVRALKDYLHLRKIRKGGMDHE